jgi:hypothetical protein
MILFECQKWSTDQETWALQHRSRYDKYACHSACSQAQVGVPAEVTVTSPHAMRYLLEESKHIAMIDEALVRVHEEQNCLLPRTNPK